MSTQPNDGGSAFPVAFIQGSDPYGADANGGHPGMTLRAYFAGQALAGEVAALSSAESLRIAVQAAELSNVSVEQHTAIQCVRYADALIAELNKSHV